MSSPVTAEQLNTTKSSIIEEIKSLSVSESGPKEQKLFVKDEYDSRQTNYVGWSIKTENNLRKKKCLNSKDEIIDGKEEEALNYLIGCISDELIEIIPKGKRQSFQTLWDYLPIKCKIGNRWDLEAQFENLTVVGVDMDRFCETMDLHIAKTERAGGKISLQSQYDLLMKRANPIFYKDTIKAFRKKQQEGKQDWRVTESILQDFKDSLLFDFENTTKEVRMDFEPKKEKPFTANNVVGRKPGQRRSSIPESEQCEYCKKHRPEKPQLAKSHGHYWLIKRLIRPTRPYEYARHAQPA